MILLVFGDDNSASILDAGQARRPYVVVVPVGAPRG